MLTLMCLLPLKRVDNESVAEGLMELIARHGIPNTILSDQSTVFTSKFTARLCALLDIVDSVASPDQWGTQKVARQSQGHAEAS